MKNNKGVTLVELLIVIVVMGIIAAFAIPAVGKIIENTQKDAIYADALAVENAAKLFCSQTTCTADEDLTWTELQGYLDSFDSTYYTLTANNGVIATKASGKWTIYLEAATVGSWEFEAGAVPSESDRVQVTADDDQ